MANAVSDPIRPTPTEAELEILRVLWDHGPCTVRDIHDELTRSRAIRSTSVSKIVMLMIDKGLVTVVDARRPQRIQAAFTRQATLQTIMKKVRNSIFGGSMADMVRHALGGGSAEDVDNVESIVRDFKSKKNDTPGS